MENFLDVGNVDDEIQIRSDNFLGLKKRLSENWTLVLLCSC